MAGTGNSSVRSYTFFDATALVAGGFNANPREFVDADDGTQFLSNVIMIANDGATDLEYRFSEDPGTGAPHGVVLSGEILTLEHKRERRIFLSGLAALAVRVWAW